jgi:hypothetical protein
MGEDRFDEENTAPWQWGIVTGGFLKTAHKNATIAYKLLDTKFSPKFRI